MNRIAILGASRGLGWALYTELAALNNETSFFLVSRKIEEKLKFIPNSTSIKAQDFSKVPISKSFLKDLQNFNPTHLIYMAGGGPYGEFRAKKWSDHQWALNTTFLYPAELIHTILADSKTWAHLKQMVFVGSAIAEDKPDAMAASYAAAKHALKGLITSIQLENQGNLHLTLFSPGYMQTELLPQSSWPVQQGVAEDVMDVAKRLIAVIEKNNQR